MRKELDIVQVHDAERKAAIVSEVLADLPEWFGLPESTQVYIDDAKELPLWAAKRKDETLGFITLTSTSEDTAEIHCMGVKKSVHHMGIGSLLYRTLEKEAESEYRFIQVKTVDEGHYIEYDQTIRFYQKMGFVKFEVFPTLWDEWNPCLVMIKCLSAKEESIPSKIEETNEENSGEHVN